MKFEDMDWQRFSNGVMQHNDHNVTLMKNLLNQTGCGMCLAKFKQVTLHLGTGMTHACHHPAPHKISLNEIQENPAALFNTNHLKHARTQMLNGERPAECDYCWRVEDDGGKSDRFFKSLEGWASEYYNEISKLTGNENIYPSYLEVSFSNVCNMKCTYCGPEFSSQWVEEMKQHGPIKLLEGTSKAQTMHGHLDLEKLTYKQREFNPYIDAFWKWFPDALPHLRHYRITGGEPLMSKETFRSMEWLINNPNTEMEFSINSNFSVPDKLWDKFVELLTEMRDKKVVKKITVYTSLEGWGKRAEYARTGLDFNLLKSRCEQIAAMDNIRLSVMSAFNLLSITSFKPMLEWILDLKKKHTPNDTSETVILMSTGYDNNKGTMDEIIKHREKNHSHTITVSLDIPYLRYPPAMDVHFSTEELFKNYLLPTLQYMAENNPSSVWSNEIGFLNVEVEKLKRIVMHRAYYNQKKRPERETHDDIRHGRAQFYDYINELDRRRNTNFLEVFPEMKEFFDTCKLAKESYVNDK
jgi:organic radical activating enzyme